MINEPPVTRRQIAAFRRFLLKLPQGKDLDLVILKAHLLIEEEVNSVINARLPNASILLREEKFEAGYRIKLAQATFAPDSHEWVWKSLNQLNKLRNRVAHQIDPKGRDDLIREILKFIPGGINSSTNSLQDDFELFAWLLHTEISSLVEPERGFPIGLAYQKASPCVISQTNLSPES